MKISARKNTFLVKQCSVRSPCNHDSDISVGQVAHQRTHFGGPPMATIPWGSMGCPWSHRLLQKFWPSQRCQANLRSSVGATLAGHDMWLHVGYNIANPCFSSVRLESFCILQISSSLVWLRTYQFRMTICAIELWIAESPHPGQIGRAHV